MACNGSMTPGISTRDRIHGWKSNVQDISHRREKAMRLLELAIFYIYSVAGEATDACWLTCMPSTLEVFVPSLFHSNDSAPMVFLFEYRIGTKRPLWTYPDDRVGQNNCPRR
jgi:hypothetical protein